MDAARVFRPLGAPTIAVALVPVLWTIAWWGFADGGLAVAAGSACLLATLGILAVLRSISVTFSPTGVQLRGLGRSSELTPPTAWAREERQILGIRYTAYSWVEDGEARSQSTLWFRRRERVELAALVDEHFVDNPRLAPARLPSGRRWYGQPPLTLILAAGAGIGLAVSWFVYTDGSVTTRSFYAFLALLVGGSLGYQAGDWLHRDR
ncbi:MAG: hypothetical protein M3Z03_15300 [Actinomycetota bacterium]|nr:hypothetical protein [Actinomycetota bacterium]